jgi:3'-phosphoadenosine 5'-phosphosulfate sulfotransferase (PAPS reductase)/FAD synthetase
MGNAYTYDDLEKMLAFTVQRKIQITTTRLLDWHRIYGGQVYMAFDGTAESRVLVEIARRFYASGLAGDGARLHLVHVRGGAELPELERYVAAEFAKIAETVGTEIEYLVPERSYTETIQKYGLPVVSKKVTKAIAAAREGMAHELEEFQNGQYSRYKGLLESGIRVSPQCCRILKDAPYKAYERRTGRARALASLAQDEETQGEWITFGCNSPQTYTSRPMSFWTPGDVESYAKAAGLTLPDFPVGCARCMYGKRMSYYHAVRKRDEWYRLCVTEPGIDRVFDALGIDMRSEARLWEANDPARRVFI